jgi:hypothetical protein
MTTGQREEARTSDGLIWTDLPYLALDLQEFATQLMKMSATHRRNLAAFTARVTRLSIADLGSCALWLLLEMLEVGRPVIMSGGVETVSIAKLLPACIAWFQYSSHKLLRRSANNHCPAIGSQVGPAGIRTCLGDPAGRSDNEQAGRP